MTYRTPNTRPFSELDMMMLREGLPAPDALRSELEAGRRSQARISRWMGQLLPKFVEAGSMVVAWVKNSARMAGQQTRWS